MATASIERGDEAAPVHQRGAYKWIVAAILMLVYACSFIDRQILSLVIDPMRKDLQITDTQVGLLAGPAFVGLHVLALLPVGWMVDRWNRRNIIVAGALFWTATTAGCGMVGSYAGLFAMRAGVGSGEAALSPSAYSLLSSYFPRTQLARALSLYGLGVPVGSALAMIGGGWMIAAFNDIGPMTIAGLGTFRPWQMVFLAVALPGLPLAAMLLLVREPPRRPMHGVAQPSLAAVLRQIWQHRWVYLPISLGSAFASVAGYGAAYWLPSVLQRAHGFTIVESGMFIGLSIVFLSIPGTLAMGWATDRLVAKGREDGPLIVGIGNVTGMILCCVLAPLIPQAAVSLIFVAGTMFFLNTWNVGVAAAVLQRVTPERMRGRVSGLHILSSALIGLGIGPLAIGLGTDFIFSRPDQVGSSLALVATLFSGAAACLMLLGRRPLRAYIAAEPGA